jgi:hypothetical protein
MGVKMLVFAGAKVIKSTGNQLLLRVNSIILGGQ